MNDKIFDKRALMVTVPLNNVHMVVHGSPSSPWGHPLFQDDKTEELEEEYFRLMAEKHMRELQMKINKLREELGE